MLFSWNYTASSIDDLKFLKKKTCHSDTLLLKMIGKRYVFNKKMGFNNGGNIAARRGDSSAWGCKYRDQGSTMKKVNSPYIIL